MTKKVAFIQTAGIGDLIITLPIADYYGEQGWEIVWPIDERLVAMFQAAKPSIKFLPVGGWPVMDRRYFFDEPLRLLADQKCEKTIVFYVGMIGLNFADTRLSASLKFDEYKYAISSVPFRQKWNLKYERDMEREQALYDSLKITGPYICVHETSSHIKLPIPIPPEIEKQYRVIRVEELTDSIFDWVLTLERASKLFFIEGCFANLVDQLELRVEKHLYLRTIADYSPVFRSGWNLNFFDPADLSRNASV